MAYVDGFLIPVPKDRLEDYRKMAELGRQVWTEYGALAYVECIGDDIPKGEITSFPRAVQAEEDETVIFSWIVYESREHRDAVNAKVMADPRMDTPPDSWPFDGKRLVFGGFTPFLGL